MILFLATRLLLQAETHSTPDTTTTTTTTPGWRLVLWLHYSTAYGARFSPWILLC
jgi:hypothetical protein